MHPQELFKKVTNSLKNKTCMYCEDKIINSHSVQNEYILEQIQEKGHVLAPNPHKKNLESIGRNKASVFNLMCNNHDTKLFKESDFEAASFTEGNLSDGQALGLLGKSIHCELYKKSHMATSFKEMLEHFPEANTSLFEESYGWSSIAWQELSNSLFHWENSLTKGKNLFKHKVFKIPTSPILAASGVFTVVHDLEGNLLRSLKSTKRLLWMSISVIPVLNQEFSYVVLSYHKNQEKMLKPVISKIENSEPRVFRKIVSSILLNHVENIFFHPRIKQHPNFSELSGLIFSETYLTGVAMELHEIDLFI